MADDDEDIAALVVDNGSGMCKGEWSALPNICQSFFNTTTIHHFKLVISGAPL